MEHVRVETGDGVAVVTLVDVERRNAMTARMVDEIVATFDALESRRHDRRGRRHRRAARLLLGRRRVEPRRAGPGRDRRRAPRRSPRSTRASCACSARRCPTIAAVNGAAVGAGLNLALACDVRLAGTSARFDTRFVKIGLHPGGGHVWMLERAVGPQAAAAMILFGVPVDGARAARDRARVVVPSRRRAARRGAARSRPAPPARRRVCSTW